MFSISKYNTNGSHGDHKGAESQKGRILCLDVGDKRIGMAISDPLWITAQGLPTFERQGYKHDVKRIKELVIRSGVQRILYGLPKNMDGTLGYQAEKTEQFINKLKVQIDCKFIPWDERLTTQYAHQTLKSAGMRRKKRAQKVDMIAAVLILQNYLDLCDKGL